MLRPGEFRITDRGLELARLKEGADVLEVGCGEGETTERLEKKYGYNVYPIDVSLEKIRITNERKLNAKAKYGDGEFLEDFSSNALDGIIAECTLSLISKPDEAIHEAFCTLKKGGKYIISDLYYKEENKEDIDKARELARVAAATQMEYDGCGGKEETEHVHTEEACAHGCEDNKEKKCDGEEDHTHEDCNEVQEYKDIEFRYKGVFFKDILIKEMEDIGFGEIIFEDYSSELETYVAETIMKGENLPFAEEIKKEKGVGYFLIVATKI